MNMSSVLIIAKVQKHKALFDEIAKIKNCSVELVEGEKIIVLIESENLDDEVAAYSRLEKLKGASAVSMVFSYQDLDEDIKKAESAMFDDGKGGKSAVPKALLDDELDAKDIKYSGDLKDKF